MSDDLNEPHDFIFHLPTTLSVKGIADTGVVYIDGKQLLPDKSLKVRNHSPDGFAWGYAGSGPAQLSLAILLEYMAPDNALEYYQSFKDNFVCPLHPHRDFETTLHLMYDIATIESARSGLPMWIGPQSPK